MKHTFIVSTFKKIWIISIMFVWILQIGYYGFNYIMNWENDWLYWHIIQQEITNANRFQSAYSSQFWVIWVAISTQVGIDYTSRIHLSDTRWYRWWDTMPRNSQERKFARERLLKENSLMIREYYNISRVDIISTLKTSSDRRRTLDNFVNQVEIRSKNATKSIENLEKQKELYLKELHKVSELIEDEKAKMETVFNSWDSAWVLHISDMYFSLRNEYTELFTDIVFINQYLRQYQFLNNYNTWIINALKVNRQQIIDGVYIVIPETGSQYIRPLELLFDEADMPR